MPFYYICNSISKKLVLFLAFVSEFVQGVVQKTSQSVGAADDGADPYQEVNEPSSLALDRNHESPYVVVKEKGGHMVDLEGVVVVSVLVGVRRAEIAIVVDSRDDIDMIVGSIRMGRPLYIVVLFMVV